MLSPQSLVPRFGLVAGLGVVAVRGADLRVLRVVFPVHADAITRQLAALTHEEQRALGNLCRKLGAVA